MSITKRIDQARDAFKKGDLAASKDAHSPQAIAAATEEHGGASHQYIGDMVYGGLDGIVTTFAIVSGVVGADLGSGIILVLGLANLLADGFSMAAGAFLALKSELEYYDREREREAWEVKHLPEGERIELLEIYRAKGHSADDAETLVTIQAKDEEIWIDEMMIQELGMLRDERRPILSALATLASFIVSGSVPLLVYLAGLIFPIDSGASFATAAFLSAAALFGLGAAKVLITERSWFRSGLEMLAVGGLAAGVAYLVGYLLQGLGG
jgi:VIT1/CCC1 family predicted Fe2+/Mn2+ transporter